MMSVLLLCSLLVAVSARMNELVLQDEALVGEVVKTPLFRKTRNQLPTNFDYRSFGLLSTDLNQHIPVYW